VRQLIELADDRFRVVLLFAVVNEIVGRLAHKWHMKRVGKTILQLALRQAID
jgi:hypothetical protein